MGRRRRGGGGRAHWSDGWAFTVAVAVAYLALSSLANSDAWRHGITHTMQTAGGADVPEEVWFLAQTPWALLHGINPLFNVWLNTPVGLNLMDNTTMPLLGLLGAPMTLLLGPIATFNILLDLAFAASAFAFYLMARRFVRWRPAAFVGGLLYGFSPFAAAEGVAHLFLVWNVVPPLVVLFLDRFLRTKSDPPWKAGLCIGVCFVAQFYISSELFASMVVMTLVGAAVGVVYWWLRRPAVDLGGLARTGGYAVAVLAVMGGYGVFMALLGPAHIHGPEQSPTALAGISSDPVGLVVPTITQHFTFGHAALGDQLVAVRDAHWHIAFDAVLENGTYVGIPLLVALVVGAVAFRRRPLVLFSTVMALAASVIALGSQLHVGGVRTGIWLPYDALAHLPLLESGEAARYLLFFWLFAGLLFTLIIDGLYLRIDRRDRPRDRLWATVASLVVVVVCLFPLVPAWPYGSSRAAVPDWFTSGARSLPVGTTVVVYPFAGAVDADAMAWQAMADMTFKMPGGYAVFPTSSGTATFASEPSVLQEAFAACSSGLSPAVPTSAVRAGINRVHASVVVVAPGSVGAKCASGLLEGIYGPPERRQGVLLWRVNGRD